LTDFHDIWYLGIFRKSVEKIQDSLKSDNNNGTAHEDLWTCIVVSRWIRLRTRDLLDKICRENKKFSFLFLRKSYRLWDNVKNVVKADKPQRTIWRINEATSTVSEYVILNAFQRQHWLREHASMLPDSSFACVAFFLTRGSFGTPVSCHRSLLSTHGVCI
jgi:hypothetical protein